MFQRAAWQWWWDVFRGKTFGRASMNERLVEPLRHCSGQWLDLGGGSSPSYAQLLPQGLVRIVADLQSHDPAQKIDGNAPLPFQRDEFDGALCFNMLYTLEDGLLALQELLRVTKPGGTLLLIIPFFFPETPEPHDYHRWTREGAERLVRLSGWKLQVIERIGGPGAFFGTYLLPLHQLRLVRILCAPFVRLYDRFSDADRFASSWMVRATKTIHPT
jgi:SAM-dependent methyltransferase